MRQPMMPRPITEGHGPVRYSLFFPMTFGALHRFEGFVDGAGDPIKFTLLGVTATVEVSESRAILHLGYWETEAEAQGAYQRLAGALLFGVTGSLLAVLPPKLEEVDRRANFVSDGLAREMYEPWTPRKPETDGMIWPIHAYVLPEHERILLMPVGWAMLTRIIRPHSFQRMCEMTETGESGQVSDREMLAFSLVAQANTHTNISLELLDLVRALEVISTTEPINRSSGELVEGWLIELEKKILIARGAKEKDEADQLIALRERLKHLRNQSISESIRTLFASAVDGFPVDPDVAHRFRTLDDARKIATEIYDIRSKLVHKGTVPSKKGRNWAQRIQEALPPLRFAVHILLTQRLRK